MAAFDRRTFLRRGTTAVAAAGVIAALPGSTAAILDAVESDGPGAADEAAQAGEAGSLSEPLIAHVRDLSSGEIGIFSGTQEVVLHDPGLAARLFQATR
jgi:molybdopterin biosynthesis enzyme MoaB